MILKPCVTENVISTDDLSMRAILNPRNLLYLLDFLFNDWTHEHESCLEENRVAILGSEPAVEQY